MWSHIFTHDYENGTKVAIILLDTQGIFDHEGNDSEFTRIFALCTMISSIQFVNVRANINSNDLKQLQAFVTQGRMTLKETTEKAFQRVLFIVRDAPYYGGFGSKAGRKLMNEFFKKQNNGSKFNEFKEQFDDISAVLLPSPGSKVTSEEFKGLIKDLESDFISNVKQMTEELFAPDKLLQKRIFDKTVTAHKFVKYLEQFVEDLKSIETPPWPEVNQHLIFSENANLIYVFCFLSFFDNFRCCRKLTLKILKKDALMVTIKVCKVNSIKRTLHTSKKRNLMTFIKNIVTNHWKM